MPNPIQDKVRAQMTGGGDLNLEFVPELNNQSIGSLRVYLHEENKTQVRVNLNNTGELATVLWLPWKQGEMRTLQPLSIERADINTLFLTYYLSGCKVFAIRGGPVWHIDAQIPVTEFWPFILQDEWVEDNWGQGKEQQVAYLHRAGQKPDLWDLKAHLEGDLPSTYGSGNLGDALVGGVVNASRQLDLYFKAGTSRWASLKYTSQRRK